MMTNGEHDNLWRQGAIAICESEDTLRNIDRDLKRHDVIEVLKELYSIGEITKEDYAESLKKLLDGLTK